MQPRIWIEKLTFSDGTTIQLEKNDVVVIVGPNNAGKSAALKGIKTKFQNRNDISEVVKSISYQKEGSLDDLTDWLATIAKKTDKTGNSYSLHAYSSKIHSSNLPSFWTDPNTQLQSLARFFCHLLTTDERLTTANPPSSIQLTTSPPEHPIHHIQRNDVLEAKLSKQFRKAFGSDLIVNRAAGSHVPMHVGEKPKIQKGQDRVSYDYVVELEKLPLLHTQGDGMRSFAGVLLNASVGHESILLVDEPEAFLHPPQARLLGQMIVSDIKSDRQLFVATHSGDLLRGMLNADQSRVRVIRLQREGDVNCATELNNSQIEELWSDSLLRYSNILDGLFHEKVIVCESDSDCRFYGAIADVLFEKEKDLHKPDVMFTHCGGKDRLPVVVRALKQLDVPIVVVTDFDVLRDEKPLRDIIEAAGGKWSDFSKDWNQIKSAIDSKKPELSTDEIKNEITKILNAISETVFPEKQKKNIQKILRRSSPWAIAKTTGVSFVPNGGPNRTCTTLLKNLESLGIFIVPVGEVEGFVRSVGNHGPSWVNEVLQKKLSRDTELDGARKFVAKFIN